MKDFAYIFIFVCVISCQSFENVKESPQKSRDIVTVDFEGFEEYVATHASQTLVINFWATWCKPCVKELPAFEQLRSKYEDKDVAVILVSLDFPEQLEALKKFVDMKELDSELVFLDDGKANDWIPKISDNWSGAIPATLIVTDDHRSFYEQSFTFSELEKEVTPYINTRL